MCQDAPMGPDPSHWPSSPLARTGKTSNTPLFRERGYDVDDDDPNAADAPEYTEEDKGDDVGETHHRVGVANIDIHIYSW